MSRIDVCVVATRRPDLLQRTLHSFDDGLFGNFSIARIIANIDPAFGNAEDQEECVRLIKSYDPDATVTTPEQAGFAAAVARVWSQSTADIVLHLEDDWLLRKPLHPSNIAPLLENRSIAQISFNHANTNWDRRRKGPFCFTRKSIVISGLKMPLKTKIPSFLTGPSFFKGSFVRAAALLMDPKFDPEKQFCRGVNKPLEKYVYPFKNLILGTEPDYYIEDIGRAWRKERNIVKHVVAGQSSWSTSEPNPAASGMEKDSGPQEGPAPAGDWSRA